jgi:hypothetical protein
MKLALMQPYFFPYIGYFELIYRADQWIVFDTAQYIKLGWVNRNRILHPVNGWQYIIVPVRKHDHQTPIMDIQIVEGDRWRAKLLGQLQHYKKKAPYFNEVISLVSTCLDNNTSSLSRLNVSCLVQVCKYLGIEFSHSLLSEMNLDLSHVDVPGDWALRISEALGASEYVNAPGGAHLFDRSAFERAGVKLTIQPPLDFVYQCNGWEFQPNLSIIDVIMWNSPDRIRDYFYRRETGEW